MVMVLVVMLGFENYLNSRQALAVMLAQFMHELERFSHFCARALLTLLEPL